MEAEVERPPGLDDSIWQEIMIVLRRSAPDIWKALDEKKSRAHRVKIIEYEKDDVGTAQTAERSQDRIQHGSSFLVKRLPRNGMVGLAIAIPVGLGLLGAFLMVVARKHHRQQAEQHAAQRRSDGGERGVELQ